MASAIPRPQTRALREIRRVACFTAAAIVLVWLGEARPVSAAERRAKGAVDHLALATVLLRDGHLERAARVLGEVDPSAKGIDRARFHSLSGVVSLKLHDYRAAASHLERAIAAGNKAPAEVLLLLAQARFARSDFRGTLRALDGLGAARRRWPGAFVLAAQSERRLGRAERAWAALVAGLVHHPGNLELARNKVLLLVELGLYQRAVEEGERLLAGAHAQAEDYVAIAEALRQAEQRGRAVLLMEQAHLRAGADLRVLVQLARAHLSDGRPLAAAGLLERAAQRDARYQPEAAELYRRAGRLFQALRLNAQVLDQAVKMRQRLGLLIELERFELAAAMAPRLSRLGLLEDQKLVYALAYTLYKTGQLEQAETWLRRIDEPQLFEKAVELRKAMAACREQGWLCL